MPSHHWPTDTVFTRRILDPDDACPVCEETGLAVCDHRHRFVQSFEGPLHLVCKLAHCRNPACPTRGRTLGPSSEISIAPPRLLVGWDVFSWIGHRRIAKDWRVPQIREELRDAHRVTLSDDSIEHYIARYQAMLAAREQDPGRLAREYRDCAGVVLSIDGLQPEKGHETLYVVREVTQRRIWFAVPLLSSAAPEVARLFAQAREWALRLDKPVLAWISDKQDAFVTGIAAHFPGVPHRYCGNHFLRDAAKPMLEMDSHAKVQMRRKVRGLRAIERDIIVEPPASAAGTPAPAPPACAAPCAPAPPLLASTPCPASEISPSNRVVLDLCAAVRGILNDDQGGPLHPPGLRMAEALQDVRSSLRRLVDADEIRPERRSLERLADCIDRGLGLVGSALADVRTHARTVAGIQACLETANGPAAARKAWFDALANELRADADPVRLHMGRVMTSFAPGLFAGADAPGLPFDNLDLERAFKHPKRHRRRIHGRAHAGAGLVQEGPTLLPALDAHVRHPGVFSHEELSRWHRARPPRCQREALLRRAVMRKARSTKKRAALLAELERRYLAAA